MDYTRAVDCAAVERTSPIERFIRILFFHTSGTQTCLINFIKTPTASGSPAGLDTHMVDQVFYILSGTGSIKIETKEYRVGPAKLFAFLAEVPDLNLKGTGEPTLHLAFNTPMLDPNQLFMTPGKV